MTEPTTEDLTISGPHGSIPARRYLPSDRAPKAELVWLHGGGFIGGDLDMPEADWVARSLAVKDIAVLSVDYRKAVDGVHFPVPSDDVLAAWQWAVANRYPAVPIHFGGASAGANLAAGVAKRIRDGGGLMPSSLVLVYPDLHAELPAITDELRAATERVGGFVLSPELVGTLGLNYAGSEAALADPYAFPANGDVSGLPPTYILNSEGDFLRASGEVFAAKLGEAGVDVEVEMEPDAAHGHLNEPDQPEATRSIDRLAGWLLTRSRPL